MCILIFLRAIYLEIRRFNTRIPELLVTFSVGIHGMQRNLLSLIN
jgi:hypothetical protein